MAQSIEQPRAVPDGWKLAPLELTPEMAADAAAAVWSVATPDDRKKAAAAALILLKKTMSLAPGATLETLAAGIATMFPAYRAMLAATPSAKPAEPVAQHPDDHHVEMFADDMKRKLAAARAKGRGGWDGDEPGMQQRLSDMLRAHVLKGDPCDVANFCMFLHQRGEAILPAKTAAQGEAPNAWQPMETAPRDGSMLRLLVQFEDHATEDTTDPAPTIGAYCETAECWQFAGWCWTHDHFTEGVGTPVGWLPMLAAAPSQGERA